VTGLAKLFGVVPLPWLFPPTFIEAKLAEAVKVATSAVTFVPYGMVTPIVPEAPLVIVLEPTCPGMLYAVISAALESA
jgi:hypothetical protein